MDDFQDQGNIRSWRMQYPALELVRWDPRDIPIEDCESLTYVVRSIACKQLDRFDSDIYQSRKRRFVMDVVITAVGIAAFVVVRTDDVAFLIRNIANRELKLKRAVRCLTE